MPPACITAPPVLQSVATPSRISMRPLLLAPSQTLITSGLFHPRNKAIAHADYMIAFTFGRHGPPDDSGTRYTWNLCKGKKKMHCTLPRLDAGFRRELSCPDQHPMEHLLRAKGVEMEEKEKERVA